MSSLALEWWVWAIAAVVLAILEVMAPASLLLGLAIGAGVVSLLLLVGGPAVVGGSIAIALLIFAVLSLVSWFVLRKLLRRTGDGHVKNFDHDIND